MNSGQQALLAWYEEQGRDLPWRHTSDPYRVLVAEVMLQQTQVERVLPKWLEFLEAFPTVEALAAAPLAEVIRRWAPLGYNLRAVRLHRIAREVVERYGGRFPESEADLLKLPGVGPYTAGAVACFAYRRPSVFLDTNLRRVLGRWFLGLPYPAVSDDTAILETARAVLPAEDAYRWHQALMDLGATVCRRRRPACMVCPVAQWCRAGPRVQGAAPPPSAQTPARAVAEPVAPYRVQPRYAGSRRYYRGRILDALRSLPPGARGDEGYLRQALGNELSAVDSELLAELLRALARDGVVALAEEGGALHASLP